MEAEYRLNALSMTSWLETSFSAFISDGELEALKRDPRVERLELVGKGNDFASWTDQTIGGQLIPWGKDAIGTNDNLTSSNLVYVLDGGAGVSANLNNWVAPVNSTFTGASAHAWHVMGIVGANGASVSVKGANPNNPIMLVKIGLADDDARAAIDWIAAHSETLGNFPITNISSSSIRWRYSDTLGPWVKKLSNRSMVVQSAGNQEEDACLNAYDVTNPYDGIVVVGGIDNSGARMSSFNNSHTTPRYSSIGSSNWGSCVEAWAPAKDVWSLWNSGMEYLSGTSMAAPYVAALAARYGTSTTSPVVREAWVRAKRQSTGFSDPTSLPIMLPSYLNPAPTFNLQRLSITNITASSTLSGTSTAYLDDKKYYDSLLVWNAGGPAPAWVEIDLGYAAAVAAIRLVPEQDPKVGPHHRQIFAGSTPAPTTMVASDYSDTVVVEPLVISLPNVVARYIRIHSASSDGWVAYREIEIYGH